MRSWRPAGLILKRGHDLCRVLRVFEERLRLVSVVSPSSP